ncbi:MAG: iron-containing alcohol dehydrogenase [Spirochaetes bacterium]|nr:iron-containing alcohol dehydrogenase [Spirochaetota bacterium]
MEAFRVRVPTVVFGLGKRRELPSLLAGTGTRAFFALDPYLEKSGVGRETASLLKEAGIDVVVYSSIEPDPDCFGVDEAAETARRESCDMVIAAGGGSAIDFGKAVAILAKNPGTCWSYTRRRDQTPNTPGPGTLPVIALPSTAGTGSEMTHYAVFTNPKLREKSTIVHDRIVPRIAVIDPELTFSCPPRLTAFTGVDALAHAIESYVNINASPFSKMAAIESIRLCARFLPTAVTNGENREAREMMAWASALAGIAIAHANPTLPHAIGQAAGGYVHMPHGASVACCLVEIMRISRHSDLEGFAEIACALDPSVRSLPLHERADASPSLAAGLLNDIGVDVKFSQFGLSEKDIEKAADIALTGYFTGISLHPKQVDKTEIMRIIRACL